MTVVAVGSFCGDSVHILLDTGAVARIYCVDPFAPGYGDSDEAGYHVVAAEQAFDDLFRGDSRVVKVKSTLRAAVASGAIPSHVDMVYVDGCHMYDCVVSDLCIAHGMCDVLAGRGWWSSDVRAAIRDVIGRPPDAQFSDSSWAMSITPSGASWRRGGSATAVSALRDAVSGKLDRIMCLTCPRGVAHRVAGIMAEFAALGLEDMVTVFHNPHNVLAHAELDRRRFANSGARAVNVKNCLLGHYGMVKFACDAGWQRVMFVEDDCRLVRPVSTLVSYFNDMPAGVNAVLDYVGVPKPTFFQVFKAGRWDHWGEIPAGTSFDNFSCYVLSRAGMQCLVDYFEHCGTEDYHWPVDAADRAWPYLTGAVPVYMPRIKLARQDGGVSLIHEIEV